MRKTLILVGFLFATSTCFSQTFMHGAGLVAFVGGEKGGDFTISEGLTYAPRLNFLETEKISLSAGIPLSIGISAGTSTSFSSSSSYGTSVGVVANLPVIINLNVARGSTKENRDKFGYFVGAGFGYHHGDYITDYYYNNTGSDVITINAVGPAANAGVRIGVGRKHRNIEIRLSYMKGLNNNRTNIFGLAGLFNF